MAVVRASDCGYPCGKLSHGIADSAMAAVRASDGDLRSGVGPSFGFGPSARNGYEDCAPITVRNPSTYDYLAQPTRTATDCGLSNGFRPPRAAAPFQRVSPVSDELVYDVLSDAEPGLSKQDFVEVAKNVAHYGAGFLVQQMEESSAFRRPIGDAFACEDHFRSRCLPHEFRVPAAAAPFMNPRQSDGDMCDDFAGEGAEPDRSDYMLASNKNMAPWAGNAGVRTRQIAESFTIRPDAGDPLPGNDGAITRSAIFRSNGPSREFRAPRAAAPVPDSFDSDDHMLECFADAEPDCSEQHLVEVAQEVVGDGFCHEADLAAKPSPIADENAEVHTGEHVADCRVVSKIGPSAQERADAVVSKLLETFCCGLKSQAVIYEARCVPSNCPADAQLIQPTSDEYLKALAAEMMLQTLLCHCRKNPRAECVLLCERTHFHSATFAQLVRNGESADFEDEAWKRIHIKYVLRSSANSDAMAPPLTELLVGLHNLTFVPDIVAVLGISELVRPLATDSMPTFRCLALEMQLFAAAISHLLDVGAGLKTSENKSDGPLILIMEDAASTANPGMLGYIGCVVDAVWGAEAAPLAVWPSPGDNHVGFRLKRLF